MRAYFRTCYWVNALLLVRAFFFRHYWARRFLAALVGLVLGLLMLGGWRGLEQRALCGLAEEFRQAHQTKDAEAMERLFCWDGVDEGTRTRLRLVIWQEQDWPIASVEARPLSLFDHRTGVGLRANLEPAASIVVTYATTDRLTSSYLVGRAGWFRYQLAVMVPAK